MVSFEKDSDLVLSIRLCLNTLSQLNLNVNAHSGSLGVFSLLLFVLSELHSLSYLRLYLILFLVCWSPEFFRKDLWFQSRPSVCQSVRNAFSPSLMRQIFWNLVYSLSGVKVREFPSLFFIFANFGPGGPKNGHFWPFFGHFCSFLDLKLF